MKLFRHAYWWWKDSHIDSQCWFVLQDHLRTLYAPHFLYASEAYYNELTVEPELEPEPESRSRDNTSPPALAVVIQIPMSPLTFNSIVVFVYHL